VPLPELTLQDLRRFWTTTQRRACCPNPSGSAATVRAARQTDGSAVACRLPLDQRGFECGIHKAPERCTRSAKCLRGTPLLELA